MKHRKRPLRTPGNVAGAREPAPVTSQGPRYSLQVGAYDLEIPLDDTEQVRALFLLIDQRTGIERAAAENLLATNKMIFAGDLVVLRADLHQALLSEALS